jgi:3-(3-hydroxy-phenyl)propionate hydroxylase
MAPCFLVAASSPGVLADFLADVDDELRAKWAALGGRWAALGGSGAPRLPGASTVSGTMLLDERDGLLVGWLRERGAVALVARPDRYVYGIARSGEELGRLVAQVLKQAVAGY